MSKATKRKHVTREVLDDFDLPTDDQVIVKVGGSQGNNLHSVEGGDGEEYLVSMPPKFRKNVWIKRGNFVLIDPIQEGDKVKGEIVRILYKEQVKHFKEEGVWPARFNTAASTAEDSSMIPDDMLPPSDDEDGDSLPNNPNRPVVEEESSSEESDEDS